MSYLNLPPLEIEADPLECARLLRELANDPPGQETPKVATPSVAVQPPAPPPNRSTTPRPTPSQAPKPAPRGEPSIRQYGGRTNRRFLILECVRRLSRDGVNEPTMGQITDAFRQNFPDENQDNLEQVVRDLANKTDKLERLAWGAYRMTED